MPLNNRYQVIRELGKGSFGQTFLAEDTYLPSRRQCVVKQFKPTTDNPQIYQIAQERFQQEAIVLERLGEGSKQIPDLYAYFTEAGQFYLVQEFINGQTLTRRVAEQGLLSEAEVRAMLLNLLPVLAYIHSKDIIHRDISPNNIIIRPEGTAVLIDFGAVKEAVGTVLNSQGEPTGSIVVGTPGFMASEQAAGLPIYSSDLYSLSLTAIYALTGKVPQALKSNPATGELGWRHYAPGISEGFAAVLDRAIQYHPRDRYDTAQAMLAALQAASNPHPVVNSTQLRPPQPTVLPPYPLPAIPGTQPQLPIPSPSPPAWIQKPSPQPAASSPPVFIYILLAVLTVVGAGFGLTRLIPNFMTGLGPDAPTDEPTDTPSVMPTQKGQKSVKGGPVGSNDPTPDAPAGTLDSNPDPSAESGFKICNRTDKTVYAAIAYKNTASDTWQSEGWWTMKAGGCATVVSGTLKNRYFYIHGEATDDSIVWEGEHKFYVTAKEFTLTDAENNPPSGAYKATFFEVDTGKSSHWTQDLCPVKGCRT